MNKKSFLKKSVPLIILLFASVFLIYGVLNAPLVPAGVATHNVSINGINATTSILGNQSTLINITIEPPTVGRLNLSTIVVYLPAGLIFVNTTKGFGANVTAETANNFTFANLTAGGQTILNWTTNTSLGFASNGSGNNNGTPYASVWFNVTVTRQGDKTLTIKTNYTDAGAEQAAGGNSTTHLLQVNLTSFWGNVSEETGVPLNNTNVTMYQFTASATGGPPTETFQKSVLSAADGSFNFTNLNLNTSLQYKLKLIYYNTTNTSTQAALKVSTVLPPFAGSMFYTKFSGDNFHLNDSTFYLEPAATLRLWVHNSSNAAGFGYEVIDQKVGFPIESNMNGYAYTNNYTDVVVPTGRDYSVMFIRAPLQFGFSSALCVGSNYSEALCTMPPKTNSSFGTLTAGTVTNVTVNMNTTNVYVYGCINVSYEANESGINVTNIIPKIVPWSTSSGLFIPPIKAEAGNNNVSNTTAINNSDAKCANQLASFNISLMSGTTYLLEFYAKNNSDGPSNTGPGDEMNAPTGKNVTLAAFQNITTGTSNINLTTLLGGPVVLYRLLGTSQNTAATGTHNANNTNFMRVNIQNETGGAMTTSMHVEVKIKNSNTGLAPTKDNKTADYINYMVESLSSGTFYIPLLNNTNWAKVLIFPNEAPPIEKTLNLSLAENNIRLVDIDKSSTAGDKGIRQMHSNGTLIDVDASKMPIQLRFLMQGTGTVITEMNASNFNPLQAMLAGKVDLEIKMSTNITMKFNNFDMFSAKQPPMFAVMDNSTMSSTSSQTWEFGNFVPKDVYDNVTIGIPYADDSFELYTYKIKIPVLYSEDPAAIQQLKAAWNETAGHTTANLPDDFLEYNNSRYRDYLNSSVGITCGTDWTTPCYMNKSANIIYLEIPHFSGVNPGSTGTIPATTGGGTGITTTPITTAVWVWSTTYVPSETEVASASGYTESLAAKERVQVSIVGAGGASETHHVGIIEMTSSTVTINVSSTPQQVTLGIGDDKKFELTDDTYYDLYVKLNSINATTSKANITLKSIHELIPSAAPEEEAAAVNETGAAEEEEAITSLIETARAYWEYIAGVIVIVIAVIVYLVTRKKEY